MDTDEFLEKGLDSDDESLDAESSAEEASEHGSFAVEAPVKSGKTKKQKNKSASEEGSHKKSLDKLKESDPEFYEFLKNEDKDLLDFDASDSSEDSSDGDEEAGGHTHKLPKKLEDASDDSSAEEEDQEDLTEEGNKTEKKKKKRAASLSLKMIDHWSQQLRASGSVAILHEAVAAFKSAVRQSGSAEVQVSCKYRVEGGAVFNAIIRLCLTDLLPMLTKLLNLPKSKDPKSPLLPSTSKKWKSVRSSVKSYLTDLIELVSQIGEADIVQVLLKHIHQMLVYFACFPKLTRILIKKLIVIWSSGEETSRVLAFLSINKMTLMRQSMLLEVVLKQMYMCYVKNSKFTSPSTLPLINFMQRTLVEMFAIDVQITYQYAFVYIRQLAIHLRNAITVKKQETCQAVYNWQYVHSLELWCRMLGALHPNPVTQPLIYPLTQTLIGTIKLIPTERYYPLRFHCVRALNQLAQSTGTFIPTLPFVLEVFQMTDFNKKYKSLSFKPFNFACILKFSKTQLTEKAFKDGLVDQLYEQLLTTLNVYSGSIAFPELALPVALQLKAFLKKCKVANYTRQLKQLLDKVQETSRVVTERRRTAALSLADSKSIAAWEKRSQEEGTPISKYHASWRKLRDRELLHEIAGKERISTDNLPTIDRHKGPRVATTEERKEFAELFESDSDESDDEERFLLKEERPKKKQKTKHSEEDEDSEEYSDFDDEDMDQLAQSGSEKEDDEEDDNEDAEDDDDGEGEDNDADDADAEVAAEEEEASSEDSDIPDTEDIIEDFKMSDIDSD